ncbi:MAG: glycerophosphodiester phosphodiesterase family protein [Xanthomonadales bacterium]|nr:glycerophosphodiester phosphodiesterase family protein [Xanthomonadales bacterium]
MHYLTSLALLATTLVLTAGCFNASAEVLQTPHAQLGPRPFYLLDKLSPGDLKDKLSACAGSRTVYTASDFSIGHRGAALLFPEHTKEGYLAGARMGAGILECDVTFTSDGNLVCRHAQCDLHTTTNILETPLAAKCTVPPKVSRAGRLKNGPEVKCCSSDLTLAEFKSLRGKMDAANVNARTIAEYMDATSRYRTDLYAAEGTVMTVQEAAELFEDLGRKHTPELKEGDPAAAVSVEDVFGSQANYAQALVNVMATVGVEPENTWLQSFNFTDVIYWVDNTDYGVQAVFLDGRDPAAVAAAPPPTTEFSALKDAGVNIIAPPIPMLLTRVGDKIIPSIYAERAKAAGLDIISWTTERSGPIVAGGPLDGSFYYQSTLDAIKDDGDILRIIDILAQDVGIVGLFSDWPATTTFYANCMDL